MGLAIARILKISFANIREVTNRITYKYFYNWFCKNIVIVEINGKLMNNAIKEQIGKTKAR